MIDRNTQRKIGFSGTIRSVQPRSNGNYWVKHDNDTKMDNAVTSLVSRFVSPYGVTNINALIDPDCKDKDLLALVTYISADERSGLWSYMCPTNAWLPTVPQVIGAHMPTGWWRCRNRT